MTPEYLPDESEYVQQFMVFQRVDKTCDFGNVLFFHGGQSPFIPGQERLFQYSLQNILYSDNTAKYSIKGVMLTNF